MFGLRKLKYLFDLHNAYNSEEKYLKELVDSSISLLQQPQDSQGGLSQEDFQNLQHKLMEDCLKSGWYGFNNHSFSWQNYAKMLKSGLEHVSEFSTYMQVSEKARENIELLKSTADEIIHSTTEKDYRKAIFVGPLNIPTTPHTLMGVIITVRKAGHINKELSSRYTSERDTIYKNKIR